METPNTIEGAITEDIMQRVIKNLGKITIHEHNRIYEAVLEGLNHNLPAARKAPADMNGDAFIAIQEIASRKASLTVKQGVPVDFTGLPENPFDAASWK